MTSGRNRKGFTLYEVLIVMVVIIVMAAVVAPNFSSFFPALKTQKAADTLIATASKAHTDAVLTLQRHRLYIVTSPREDEQRLPYLYLAVEYDPLRDPGVFKPLQGAWGQPDELPDDVIFQSLEGAQDDADNSQKYYEFGTDGTATEGSIVVANSKGDTVTIKITGATGKVEIDDTVKDKP